MDAVNFEIQRINVNTVRQASIKILMIMITLRLIGKLNANCALQDFTLLEFLTLITLRVCLLK